MSIYDQINEAFEKLAQCWEKKYCAPAQINITPSKFLRYQKHNNKWGLFLITEPTEYEQIETPITSAPLRDRISAASYLGLLEDSVSHESLLQQQAAARALAQIENHIEK